MKRLFMLKSEIVGDRRMSVHRITCSECGFTAPMHTSSNGNPFPPEVVARHFRLKGWEVGDREGQDVCPTCVKAAQDARRKARVKLVADKAKKAKPEDALQLAAETFAAMQEEPMPNPAPAVNSPEVIVDTATPAPAPATERTMSREERRIMFSLMNDVYLDADKGYKPGWNDRRVAENLGVPQPWVVTLREEMFGPEGDSVEVRRLLDEITALKEQAERDLDQMRIVVEQGTRRMEELGHRLNMLSTQATRLTAALS